MICPRKFFLFFSKKVLTNLVGSYKLIARLAVANLIGWFLQTVLLASVYSAARVHTTK